MHVSVPALLAFLALSSACQSTPPATAAERRAQEQDGAWLEEGGQKRARDLPAGWQEGTAREFAAALPGWDLPVPLVWSHAAHTELNRVLLEPAMHAHTAQLSVRAAVLLAKDPSVRTQNSLLIRLERRLPPAERGRQGVEVTCANVLSRMEGLPEKTMGSLHKLATGTAPHPDLDVRVECARAYLAHIPQTETAPTPLRARACLRFLIKVLRSETPAQIDDPITWSRTRTVAWPKGRAAEEIARWLPTEEAFRPDGPWQDQVDWAKNAEVGLGL